MRQIYFVLISLLLVEYTFSIPIFNSITTNQDTIGRFEKFEITINLSANFSNPFNKNEIHLRAVFTSPTGQNISVDGFYFQDYTRLGPPETLLVKGTPNWKIRFTPSEIGTWSYKIFCTDITGSSESQTFQFLCISSQQKGFIRVANNRYLKFDAGEKFFGVGLNMGWYEYPEKTFSYQKWIDSLAANGGNLIRVWMSENAFAIEWKNTGLGNYMNRLDRAYQLDWLFEYAKSKQVYIQLCLIPHGQFSIYVNPEWNDNPYNASNGGPCPTPENFFTNPVAKEFFKRRLDYIIARWSYATNLFAWEIFNEVDHTHNFNQNRQNVTQWLLEMAQYIKSKDIYNHLLTTSYANEFLDPAIWISSYYDLIQIHHYNTTSDMQTALWELTNLATTDYNKPTAIGEYDFLDWGYFARTNDPQGINFHNTLWASVMSGAYATAMTWSWDIYIANNKLFYHFKPVADFINRVDLLSKNFIPITPKTLTSIKSDFAVPPAYPNWGLSPANNFIVLPEGKISPNSINLSKFLYGTAFNSEFRNPPYFNVSYTEPGEFKVIIGSSIGIYPRLQIWLNGIKRLDQVVNINATYSINVPAGEHQIFVDNQGIDWMRIAEYVFTNFSSGLRSYALKSNDEIIGWVQNRSYNWRYLRDLGSPPPVINNGKLIFENVQPNAIYKVEWFNPINSTITKVDTIHTNSDTLVIDLPPILWDYAYHIQRISSLGIVSSNTKYSDISSIKIFPNPTNGVAKFNFNLDRHSKVDVKIYNLLGEMIKSIIEDKEMSAGSHEIKIEMRDLPSGIYLINIKANHFNTSKKLVLIK